jgi:Flp pilus assembly protein TadD
MLDAEGRGPESAAALEQALRQSPVQAAIYLRACVFLLRQKRMEDALRISAGAVRSLPADRQMVLLRAVVLEQAGRTGEAQTLIEQLQNRWPEWQPAWSAAGVILGTHGHLEDARAALHTAVVLGAGAEVKRYLSELSSGEKAQPPDLVSLLLAAGDSVSDRI